MFIAATLLMGLLTISTAPPPAPTGMMPMPMVAPYVHQSESVSNSVVVANSAAKPISLTVVLRGMDGKAVATKSIVVPARDRLGIPLVSLLPKSNVTGRFDGSLLITAASGIQALGAVLAITDHSVNGEPSFVDEEFQMPSSTGSATLRAVAQPGVGAVKVRVTSLGAKVQHLKWRCIVHGDKAMKGKPIWERGRRRY